MSDNLTTAKSFRRYGATEGRVPSVDPNFVHKVPSGDATPPTWPDGALTTGESRQVQMYLDSLHNEQETFLTYQPTAAAAITKKAAFRTYYDSTAHKNWRVDNNLQRLSQWAFRFADHMAAAEGAVPPSADSGGTGSGGATSPVAQTTL
jgi:hypothetical protein